MINDSLTKTATNLPSAVSELRRISAVGLPLAGSLTSLAWAMTIATLYILIPWETLSGRPKFADLDNYLDAIGLVASMQGVDNLSGLGWLFAEPGWTLITLLIARFSQEPLEALRIVSWICSIAFLWFMHRRAGVTLSLIIMFNPLVLDLIFSQVRSATALALLLTALGNSSRLMKSALLIYACTVHSVSVILISLYFIAVALEYSSTLRIRLVKGIVCVGVALILAWMLSYGRESLLTAIGDRRAEYDVDSGSVLFVSFWMFWALTTVVARNVFFSTAWNRNEGIVVMLFSLAFFMTVFSTNGVRFVSLALPLFACILNSIRPATKTAITALIISYQSVQFAYWY